MSGPNLAIRPALTAATVCSSQACRVCSSVLQYLHKKTKRESQELQVHAFNTNLHFRCTFLRGKLCKYKKYKLCEYKRCILLIEKASLFLTVRTYSPKQCSHQCISYRKCQIVVIVCHLHISGNPADVTPISPSCTLCSTANQEMLVCCCS